MLKIYLDLIFFRKECSVDSDERASLPFLLIQILGEFMGVCIGDGFGLLEGVVLHTLVI